MAKRMDDMKAGAAQAAGGSGMTCPKCGCKHLPSRASNGERGKTYRYRRCRNCGHQVFTREEIIRDVQPWKVVPEDSDDENEILPPKNSNRVFIHKAG